MYARISIVLLLGLSLSACDGCSRRSRPAVSYLRPEAELVLQLRREDVLARMAKGLPEKLPAVVKPAQVASWQKELQRRMGFDALSAEGLKSAGLDPSASVAAELAAAGDGALWVIPVKDAAKLEPVVAQNLSAWFQATLQPAEHKGAQLKLYKVSFGPKEVTRAGYTFTGRVLLLAFGADAEARLRAALDQDPSKSLAEQADYRAWVKEAPRGWFLRVFYPKDAGLMLASGQRLARAARLRMDPRAQQRLQQGLKHSRGAGITVSYEKLALRLQGKLQLDGAGTKALARWFSGVKAPPPSLFAADMPRSLLGLTANLDLAMLLGELTHKRLPPDPAGVHVSIGGKDLDKVPFKQVVGDPMSVLWTSIATTSTRSLSLLDPQASAALDQASRPVRKVAGVQLREIVDVRRGNASLGERFSLEGAHVFATDAKLSDAIIAKKQGSDPLNGQPGLLLSVYPTRIAERASTLPPSQIPLMFRVLFMRGLTALTWVEALQLKAQPDGSALRFSGELKLSPAVKQVPKP